jgi:acetyl-CoA synthetase
MKEFIPSEDFVRNAYIKSIDEYNKLYQESITDMEGFWARMAEDIVWFKKWDKVFEGSFSDGSISWFKGGKLNVSYNCLDRHLTTWRRNKAALIWEGEPRGESKIYTYQELHREVCLFANMLKKKGIGKGDRVVFYMPMIPELVIGILACTRIGAIHSVVFGGFSAQSLKERIIDCQAKLVVTVDGGFRGGKIITLKANVDEALKDCHSVETCIVFERAGIHVNMKSGRDIWGREELDKQNYPVCEPEHMDAEDGLFILYTSGSTGKPKGLLHTTGGYLVYVTQSFKYIFDYHEEDIYWCTADIGWITGHSYIVYGPLSNGATTLMFEGIPTYPQPDRFWEIIEKHKVNIFYTAPTVIRSLARYGEDWVKKRDLSSLRLLGTVGEPINPEAWLWYWRVVGQERCPIVDTWWQTETGGILIAPIPGAIKLKPGSATKPFFGIEPAVVDKEGKELTDGEKGILIIKKPWPGLARTIYGDHERYVNIYLSEYLGRYFTGDGAYRDKDGDYWLLGRIDDVINVSGHRLGTAEIESALVTHEAVVEAAVVGYPHEIKGEGIYAFVILNTGVEKTDALKLELIKQVAKEIGPIAKPDKIQFADGLPKTRSGKIMRRILRKIASGDTQQIGDITTLADPTIIQKLIKEREDV